MPGPLLVVACLAWLAAPAPRAQELVPPDQAYLYTVSASADAIRLSWNVLPGYYLYRDKFAFASRTEGISLKAPQLPAGKMKTDEFFGEMEIYRGRFEVSIPIDRSGDEARDMTLEIRSQGCADIGICFPPQVWVTEFRLPKRTRTQAATDTSRGVLSSLFGTAGAVSDDDEILPPEQAFVLSADMAGADQLRVRWDIAPGHYMYRDKFRFSAEPATVRLGPPQFPGGEFKEDEYFGRSEVFYGRLEVLLPLTLADSTLSEFMLRTESQGCKENGICYPPFVQQAPVALMSASQTALTTAAPAATGKVSEQSRQATLIREGHIGWVLLAFFGFGLLLAFTPCVLPMIPILSGIIAGQGDDVNTRRAFMLSLTYVLGMATTYTIAGATAALFGQQMQAIFQQPWIIIGFALLFVVLALSMFGLYELQMPGAVQSRVTNLSNRQKAGTYIGTAVMGVLSALIVTACVAPPLVAALAVIGQTGEPLRGAAALFAMSLGMGAPLLVVGASAGKLLPKAGPWMNAVKAAFGVMLLGVAIWMLERVLPRGITMFLWGALLLVTGVYLGAARSLSDGITGWQRLWRALGLLILVYGILMLVGVASGSKNTWRPLSHFGVAGKSVEAEHGLPFEPIKTVADLNRRVAAASAAGQTVMVDFYADWCVSCLEMEEYTFSDPEVQAALADTILLQADVTANDEEDKALQKHFGIYGPPTIAFYDRNGRELEGYRVVGFVPAREFAAHVREAVGAATP